MTLEDIHALHRDPANWHFVFIYFAPGDPRIVVKKRLGITGWTLNFARPLAVPFLAALIAFVYAYVALVSRLDLSESSIWFAILLLIVFIFALCGWMSNPRRFAR